MRRLALISALLMASMALVPAATAAEDTSETYRYVAGSSPDRDVPEPDLGLDHGACTHERNGVPTGLSYLVPALGPDAVVYAGGACGHTDVGQDVTVTVEDAVRPGPVGFSWVFYYDLAHGGECASGHATGQVTVHVSDACNGFRISPDAGTVAGTITLTAAS